MSEEKKERLKKYQKYYSEAKKPLVHKIVLIVHAMIYAD